MVAAHAESAHIPSRSSAGSAAVSRGSWCRSSTQAASDCMQSHRSLVFIAGIAAMRSPCVDISLVIQCSVPSNVCCD